MIYLWDIHSTIFDEHQEYTPALNACIQAFINAAAGEIPPEFASEKDFYQAVYADLKKAHVALQSDWADEAFNLSFMTTLRKLFVDDESFNTARMNAVATRHHVSQELIRKHAYPGIVDRIKDMRAQGHAVYLCTDANRTCVEDTIAALGLKDVINGAFCCRSTLESDKIAKDNITCLPPGAFKPNARIVGEILLSYLKLGVMFDDVFELTHQTPFHLEGVEDFVCASLVVKPEWRARLLPLLEKTVVIGDSWRDMLLAFNAGVHRIEAGYGSRELLNSGMTAEEFAKIKAHNLEVVERVTFWTESNNPVGKPVDRMSLMNGEQKKIAVKFAAPDFVCERAINEARWMSRVRSAEEMRVERNREMVHREMSALPRWRTQGTMFVRAADLQHLVKEEERVVNKPH